MTPASSHSVGRARWREVAQTIEGFLVEIQADFGGPDAIIDRMYERT